MIDFLVDYAEAAEDLAAEQKRRKAKQPPIPKKGHRRR